MLQGTAEPGATNRGFPLFGPYQQIAGVFGNMANFRIGRLLFFKPQIQFRHPFRLQRMATGSLPRVVWMSARNAIFPSRSLPSETV